MLPNYLSYETIQEKMLFIQSLNEEKRDELLVLLREKNPREYRKIAGKINATEQEISLFEKASITSIPIHQIEINPYQPRKVFNQEKLDSLAESIKEDGLISPVLLSKVNSEQYILIAGERRFRSYQKLYKEVGDKFCEIEAKVLNNVSDKKLQTLAILENIQREDLTLKEEAKSLLDLNQAGMTIVEIAKTTGMSGSKVGRYIKIAKLHDIVLSEMEKLNITSSTLMEFIATLDDVDTQIKAMRQSKDGKTIQELKKVYGEGEKKEGEKQQPIKSQDEKHQENRENNNKPIFDEHEDDEELQDTLEHTKQTEILPRENKTEYEYKDNILILKNIDKELKNKILDYLEN